eukprot:10526440-Lingulodinium_polyedra.AAC.1
MTTARAKMLQRLRMMRVSPMGATMAAHFARTGERGHFRTTCFSLYRANGLPWTHMCSHRDVGLCAAQADS